MSDRATPSRPGSLLGPGAAWIRAHSLEVALALPLVGYLLLLTAAPIVETVRLSLSAPLDGGFPSLGRYRALLASDLFRAAFRNTIVVVLLSLVLEIGLGLLVALTLHRRFPLRGLVRTLVLMPLGVPTVVSAAVMLLVFSRAGYLNGLLLAAADALALIGVHWRFEPVGWTVAGGLADALHGGRRRHLEGAARGLPDPAGGAPGDSRGGRGGGARSTAPRGGDGPATWSSRSSRPTSRWR